MGVKCKVLSVLNEVIDFNGVIDTRKLHIFRLSHSGYLIENDGEARVFADNRGSRLSETDLTKIGMDFAEYLQSLVSK